MWVPVGTPWPMLSWQHHCRGHVVIWKHFIPHVDLIANVVLSLLCRNLQHLLWTLLTERSSPVHPVHLLGIKSFDIIQGFAVLDWISSAYCEQRKRYDCFAIRLRNMSNISLPNGHFVDLVCIFQYHRLIGVVSELASLHIKPPTITIPFRYQF